MAAVILQDAKEQVMHQCVRQHDPKRRIAWRNVRGNCRLSLFLQENDWLLCTTQNGPLPFGDFAKNLRARSSPYHDSERLLITMLTSAQLLNRVGVTCIARFEIV